jgi:tRNA (guanine-N7-)-methyltransferase
MFTRLPVMILALQCTRAAAFCTAAFQSALKGALSRHFCSSKATLEEVMPKHQERRQAFIGPCLPPWNDPQSYYQRVTIENSKKANRFRQHVNPLARQYQLPCRLPRDWPHCVYHDTTQPLHLDIGCSKGGFLIDMAAKNAMDVADNTNYLGLEIRPGVAHVARNRIRGSLVGRLEFLGCNVNVDLNRLLSLYPGSLKLVTIQFPDPHFKSQHMKRRVVNHKLVDTLARHTSDDANVFLQSDVQLILDDMRERFASSKYFSDACEPGQYLPENVLGVPTEREVSVIERGLPVFRSLFVRNQVEYTATICSEKKEVENERMSYAAVEDSEEANSI